MPRSLLPKGVFEKNGAYYRVKAEGPKRRWIRLTRISEGLPAMFVALANLIKVHVEDDSMPTLCRQWLANVSITHSKKTQANDEYQVREISERMAEFRARDIKPPHVVEFLKTYRDRPRSHNHYRAMFRELMRFAEEKGHRPPGSNPVDSVRTMSVKARDRYLTDSEVRRIKVAAMRGDDGKLTRSGPVICALIDVAYLTGQRISDLLNLRWSKRHAVGTSGLVEAPYMDDRGIFFQPSKTASSTGAKLMVEWSPALRAAIARLLAMKRRHLTHVFCTQEGQPYTYWGASTAWRRAVKRAKVRNCHFHDLRAKALTDKDRREGIRAAQLMGAHSTESQTADYVRHKTARSTPATR